MLVLTQPDNLELDTLIEITDQDFFDMLAYFTSVPRQVCTLPQHQSYHNVCVEIKPAQSCHTAYYQQATLKVPSLIPDHEL